jgi:hypothetical protein
MTQTDQGDEMKRNFLLVLFGSILLFGSVSSSQAQEMHIDGYLCGN